MPTKQATPFEAKEEVKADLNACGHVNEHYQGDGIQACTLPKGHAGNHSAPYQRMIRGSEALPTGAKYEKATSVWSDDAGIPLEVIEGMLEDEKAAKPKAPPSLTQRLTDEDRARMQKADLGE